MYHPLLLKLKNVLSEIHLLLTPDREHGKVFERIPVVGFRRAKREGSTSWQKNPAPSDLVEVLYAKYGHMLLLVKHLDLLVPKQNITLTPITRTVVPTMLRDFFDGKDVLKNTQVVRKVSDLDLTIISLAVAI